MKRILVRFIFVIFITSWSMHSFGQGIVVVENHSAMPILLFTPGSGTTVPMYGSAGTYDLGLYMGSAGSSTLAQMQLVDVVANSGALQSSPTGALAGLFAAPNVISPGNVPNTLDFQNMVTYAFLLAGWTAADGSTYAQAAASGDPNAYLGISALGSITPENGTGGYAPPNVFGNGPGQVGGFILSQGLGSGIETPEPGTIVLGGLGVTALLLFRRRK